MAGTWTALTKKDADTIKRTECAQWFGHVSHIARAGDATGEKLSEATLKIRLERTKKKEDPSDPDEPVFELHHYTDSNGPVNLALACDRILHPSSGLAHETDVWAISVGISADTNATIAAIYQVIKNKMIALKNAGKNLALVYPETATINYNSRADWLLEEMKADMNAGKVVLEYPLDHSNAKDAHAHFAVSLGSKPGKVVKITINRFNTITA